MLRPEVKQCLDKVMYQLDLCKNTLGLLEKRISTSESNLQSVMEFIRTEDINYVSDHEGPRTSYILAFFSTVYANPIFFTCLTFSCSIRNLA